ISGKPPACPGATAKKQGILPTDIFKRTYANYHALWDTSTPTLKQHIIVQKRYEGINWGFSPAAPTPTVS
ncbi:MAG: hypothetical protein LBM04_07990, partial [Opitutaceae bacterium]|nr:hypothetical protein [Opitutaceae bacterium]